MKQNYIGKLLLGGALVVSGGVWAQKTDAQKQAEVQKIMKDRRISDLKLSGERETPAFIQFDSKTPLPRYQTQYQLGKYLSLKEGVDELRTGSLTETRSELAVQEYNQYFKGVPVEFGSYKTLVLNENTLLAAGAYYEIPTNFNTRATITKEAALQIALAKVAAQKYAWEQVQELMAQTTNLKAKQELQKELNEYLPQGKLVIVKDFTKEVGVAEMHLAYRFNIYAAKPMSRDMIYVDAHNGKILFDNPLIHHISDTANVPTRYAGNRRVYTSKVSGNDPNSGTPIVSSHPTTESYLVAGAPTWVLIDSTRGNTVQTYDLNGVGGAPVSLPGVYNQGKSFTDVDNKWTYAEHHRGTATSLMGGSDELENDDIAFDAHWGAEIVYDYWMKKQGRLSYDGKNAAIRSFIHYGEAYDNAFWNGSVMTYGDGSGNKPASAGFRALTSLDVCGHEIGHGVCSNTSNLAYQKESGAMNEGFSDIWAACIENYAIDSVDPSLATKYQPFFIGEQISYTAKPLRYMDNPKGTSGPDTYGKTNWRAVDCTPTLANDQCGVHTNSSVLNKWFYLMTVGSGTGSGPDMEWAGRGANLDDQVNDNGATYSVTGVGFQKSERITYLTELILSATATYAEARQMSIAVATALSSNPCSDLVQTVTNSWYAVGVGAAFTTPCNVTYGFVMQPSATINEGSATGVGCTSVRTLILPILIPANGAITVALSGTAAQGDDYTVNTTSFTNSGTTDKTDSVKLSIKNDAVVEGAETIILTISATGTSSNPVNTTFTVNILDNDVVPTIGTGVITILDSTTTGSFTGANGFASGTGVTGGVSVPGFTQVLEVPEGVFSATGNNMPNGKNQWALNNNQLVVTGKVFATDAAMPGGTYNLLSTSQSRIQTTAALDSRGLNNLRISFNYTVQGEVDPATATVKNNGEIEYSTIFDYMALAYSLDGVNYTELADDSFPRFGNPTPTTGRFARTLPSSLNNQLFYLAFRWSNDANAGGPQSILLDNLSITGSPKKIETTENSYTAENLVAGQEVYFYSQNDGDIIAKVRADASTYGCTGALVEHAGNSTFRLYRDANTSYIVADKVIRLTPATNNAGGVNRVSLYMTLAEIQAIETAVGGADRNSFTMFKTTASDYTGANTSNVEKVTASYTAITSGSATIGGIFTATFSTGFSSFALGASTPVILPVTCTNFTAKLNGNTTQLQWKLETEVNNKGFDIERSVDGTTFATIAQVKADAANKGLYNFTDSKTEGLKAAYYRIRQYDMDGRSTYICQTAYVRFGGKALVIGNMYPNPVTATGTIQVNTDKAFRLQADFINVAGQTIRSAIQNVAAGDNTIQILKTKLPAGTYLLRFTDGETGSLLKTQTFIQQ